MDVNILVVIDIVFSEIYVKLEWSLLGIIVP